MLTHPLFWIYLFIQLRIFLHLTNSVSFHPRWRINETSWTLFWTILFLSSQTLLSFYLMREWDFAFWEWPILSGPCKLFSAGVYGWGGYLWLNHPYWVIFKKKKPLYKLLSRKKVQVPAKFKAPFGFLKSIGLENQIYQPEDTWNMRWGFQDGLRRFRACPSSKILRCPLREIRPIELLENRV